MAAPQSCCPLVFLLKLSFLCHFLLLRSAQGYMVDGDPTTRADFLDPEEKYHLMWHVNWDTNRITFNVTVKTQGWVLFGLANNDWDETGKDVVIGGIMEGTGQAYFSDRHEEGNGGQLAINDEKQDYKLEQAWEENGETFLSFSRDLDSCDPEDYPITDNKVTLIWAYGDSDNLSKNPASRQRGSFNIYLLEAERTPRIVRDPAGNPTLIGAHDPDHHLQLWTLSVQERLPTAHTSYLCTIHKAPRLRNKHHVIGFEVFLPDAQSLEHVHHYSVYKCTLPRGYSERDPFQRFVGAPGKSCFFRTSSLQDQQDNPHQFCDEIYLSWGIGMRAFFFPPQAGVPLREDSDDEYYLVQAHYDNPQHKENVDVTIRMDIWYTPHLRLNDVGYFGMGVSTPSLPPTIVVPPHSTNHRAFGHCSSECMQRILPPEGIKVFAAVLHSHHSGVGARLRHFDMEKKLELPWISYDDNYSNRFQAVRPLRENVSLLPGDQLTVECTYDNTWTNGSVLAGFATAQEMCSGFMYYYGRMREYSQCRSQIVDEPGRRRFLGGVENMTWTEERIDWVATTPRRLAGLTVTEIADRLPWDEEEREELQKYHEVTESVASCSKHLSRRDIESVVGVMEGSDVARGAYPSTQVDTEDDFSGFVGYPFDAKPYVPPKRKCLPS